MASDDEDRVSGIDSVFHQRSTSAALMRKRILMRVLFVLGSLLLVGLLFVFGLSHGTIDSAVPEIAQQPSAWRFGVALGLVAVGITGLMVALILAVRSGHARTSWRSPVSLLSKAQRNELSDEASKKSSLSTARHQLAMDSTLAQINENKYLILNLSCASAILLGQVLLTTGLTQLVTLGILTGALLSLSRLIHRISKLRELLSEEGSH